MDDRGENALPTYSYAYSYTRLSLSAPTRRDWRVRVRVRVRQHAIRQLIVVHALKSTTVFTLDHLPSDLRVGFTTEKVGRNEQLVPPRGIPSLIRRRATNKAFHSLRASCAVPAMAYATLFLPTRRIGKLCLLRRKPVGERRFQRRDRSLFPTPCLLILKRGRLQPGFAKPGTTGVRFVGSPAD